MLPFKDSASKNILVQTSIEGGFRLASTLRKKFSEQILIVVPRAREAELLAQTVDLGQQMFVLHGKTPLSKRELIIRAWRAGTAKTLIGTRQVTLLPAKKIEAILILDAGSDDHVSIERNPRFDARLAAELLARQHDAKLIQTGPLPRVEDIVTERSIIWSKTTECAFVSLKAQEEWTGTPFLSETLKKSIQQALQDGKSVLCSFNRRGVAKRLQCKDCGHIPVCRTCGSVPTVREGDLICPVCHTEMWIPKTCPACRSDKLTHRGLGNKGITSRFQRAFPQAKVGVIDKTEQEIGADILIATEYFFKSMYRPFSPERFGVVAELSVDFALGGSDFRAAEKAAYKLHRLLQMAQQQKAECIIQTWLPDLVKPMLGPQNFLMQELEIRQEYNLPPKAVLVQISCKGMTGDQIYSVIDSFKQEEGVTVQKVNEASFEIILPAARLSQIGQKLYKLPDQCIMQIDINSYERKKAPTSSR